MKTLKAEGRGARKPHWAKKWTGYGKATPPPETAGVRQAHDRASAHEAIPDGLD